jgi:hypothetical protein
MAAKVVDAPALYQQSMEEFFKVAKYPLVKECDMTAEMKEEAIDVCITAVEKFPGEREKCTQVCIDRAVCMGQFREYNTTTSSKTLSLDA